MSGAELDRHISSMLMTGKEDATSAFLCIDTEEWSASQSQRTSRHVHRLLAKRAGLPEDIWEKAHAGMVGQVNRGGEEKAFYPFGSREITGNPRQFEGKNT